MPAIAPTPSKEKILALIEEHRVQFVELWFTDITGIVKSITVPSAKIGSIIDRGTHFDGSSLDGFARVAESDMVLMPDLNTFTLLPWSSGEEQVSRLICTVYTPQGEPFIGDPRTVLIKALKQAEQMGFAFKTGMELEFFLFNTDENGKPVTSSPHDQASYFDMSTEQAQIIRRRMLSTLDVLNIQVDSTHSEIGYGQHEIDLDYADALTSADYVLTARIALKTVAQQYKLHCTFMPRPVAELPGSGMHTHQTLHDLQTGKNVFVDTGHEYGMSEQARYFLAGQLCHARAMCAILAPLVNSYKRLGTSFEAPAHITWAHINRGALIRVPGVPPGMEDHTRLELRCPDPASNPYLATAVMLIAGLDGIRNKMPLPEPLEETLLNQTRTRRRQVEMLPNTLGEALEALEQDDVIMGALGPYISDRYLTVRRQEYAEYEQQITRWELDRYINRY
ncbi:MAG TPA: glutamine synthetase family protein [Phototrophicaceae bacterium]|jgi:glutamine synthetase|nr:glutamine synthetase family protein [Phototrophicaceae bacterium]